MRPGTGVNCVPDSGPLIARPNMSHWLPVSASMMRPSASGAKVRLLPSGPRGRKDAGGSDIPTRMLMDPASSAEAVPGDQKTTMSWPATDRGDHPFLGKRGEGYRPRLVAALHRRDSLDCRQPGVVSRPGTGTVRCRAGRSRRMGFSAVERGPTQGRDSTLPVGMRGSCNRPTTRWTGKAAPGGGRRNAR